jgi:hypothetical protein
MQQSRNVFEKAEPLFRREAHHTGLPFSKTTVFEKHEQRGARVGLAQPQPPFFAVSLLHTAVGFANGIPALSSWAVSSLSTIVKIRT